MEPSPPLIERPEVGLGSFERETVLDAFVRNPASIWTAESLSSWYRIRLDLVRAILGELAEERIISRTLGRPDRCLLNPEDPTPLEGASAGTRSARTAADRSMPRRLEPAPLSTKPRVRIPVHDKGAR